MILDHCRNLEELKKLYESRPMPRSYSFEFLINNPNLFCFYDELKGFLRGFITVQEENGLLTLSGVSIRKNMPDNIQAIIKVCNMFEDRDMFAFTPLKHAALVLKKAGFKKLDNDNTSEIYIRRSKKWEALQKHQATQAQR